MGYGAIVDPKSASQGFMVIVSVDIAVNDGTTIEDFEAAALQLPQVVEIRRMFGQPDYYLRVLVADHEEYEALTLNKLTRLPALSRLVSHQTMRLARG